MAARAAPPQILALAIPPRAPGAATPAATATRARWTLRAETEERPAKTAPRPGRRAKGVYALAAEGDPPAVGQAAAGGPDRAVAREAALAEARAVALASLAYSALREAPQAPEAARPQAPEAVRAGDTMPAATTVTGAEGVAAAAPKPFSCMYDARSRRNAGWCTTLVGTAWGAPPTARLICEGLVDEG